MIQGFMKILSQIVKKQPWSTSQSNHFASMFSEKQKTLFIVTSSNSLSAKQWKCLYRTLIYKIQMFDTFLWQLFPDQRYRWSSLYPQLVHWEEVLNIIMEKLVFVRQKVIYCKAQHGSTQIHTTQYLTQYLVTWFSLYVRMVMIFQSNIIHIREPHLKLLLKGHITEKPMVLD